MKRKWYKWASEWASAWGQWQITNRTTGRVLGMVVNRELHGTTVFEALVFGVTGKDELHCGFFDHWTGAKRAVVAKLEERRDILPPGALAEAAAEHEALAWMHMDSNIERRFAAILGPEIESRRAQQDEKHGGPAHDDTHSMYDWCGFVVEWVKRAVHAVDRWHEHETERGEATAQYENRMFDVAALAVAAILSSRRKTKETDNV